MPGLDDAAKSLTAASEPTVVEYGGHTFRVCPPADWPNSAMDALATGRYNVWAAKCLVNDRKVEDGAETGSDDGALFVAADFTLRQNNEFITAYTVAAGQAPGE